MLFLAACAARADEETRKDLAVRRDTSVPFWWALRTLLKVSDACCIIGRVGGLLQQGQYPLQQGGRSRTHRCVYPCACGAVLPAVPHHQELSQP